MKIRESSFKNNQDKKNVRRSFKIDWQKILLYYSTAIITISFIGGIYSMRWPKDILLNLLFLPVVIYLWRNLIKYWRKKKLEN